MRIRSIKPEFWRSDDIAALDWHDRLVFIGIWSYVDDNGVGRDDERLIAADLFALDDLSVASVRVQGALKRLTEQGLITRYTVNGRRYLHVTTWARHQKINRPSPGRYPAPTSANAVISEDSKHTHHTLTEPSCPGTEEQGSRGSGSRGAARAGARLPLSPDFALTDPLRAWATDKHPHLDIDAVTAKFIDHFTATGDTKVDWVAAWRYWVANERTDRTTPAGPTTWVAPTVDEFEYHDE